MDGYAHRAVTVRAETHVVDGGNALIVLGDDTYLAETSNRRTIVLERQRRRGRARRLEVAVLVRDRRRQRHQVRANQHRRRSPVSIGSLASSCTTERSCSSVTMPAFGVNANRERNHAGRIRPAIVVEPIPANYLTALQEQVDPVARTAYRADRWTPPGALTPAHS